MSNRTGPRPPSPLDAQIEAAAVFEALLSPELYVDPYPHYARIRRLTPILRVPGAAVLTTYDDCDSVLRDPANFPMADAALRDANGPTWRRHPSLVGVGHSLISQNPPVHTRLRRLIGSAFAARRAYDMTEQITRLIDGRLDAIAETGADGEVVDLFEMLALPLPFAVIATMLGIPESDWRWLRPLAADLAQIIDLFITYEQIESADAAQLAITAYLGELAADRNRRPRADLISALVAVRDEETTSEPRLSDDELMSMLSLLFLAGYETTVNLLSTGIVTLLRDPRWAAPLREDPVFADAFVEELLRHDAPVQGVSTRFTRRATMLGDVELPAGTEVLALLGAANRDPSRYPDPDRFDPARSGPKVLSFGAGIHFCVGAPLARLEARLALPALVRRFPELTQTAQPRRRASFNMRGYVHVPVTVN